MCKKGTLESAWIKAMGFIHKKQSPRWSKEDILDYDIPVGSHIEFYCSDPEKRPKKDIWDSNKDDGVISTYCSHKGALEVTMNPAGELASYMPSGESGWGVTPPKPSDPPLFFPLTTRAKWFT